MKDDSDFKKFNRRDFLKASGAASAVLGSAGVGMFGYAAGKDKNTYLGWQTYEGVNQFFDRAPWEVDKPTYEKVGHTSRPDARVEQLFNRRGQFYKHYKENLKIEEIEDELLRNYYLENPDVFALDVQNIEEIMPALRKDDAEYGQQFFLAESWANAMGAVGPPRQSNDPPEIADFPRKSRRTGEAPPKMKMKSPEKTSKLIKKISHELGSTLVGITKLNPDWVYKYPLPRRGFPNDEPLEVPKHWEYAIVVGTPHSWDAMYSNPTYGTSNDAYSRTRVVAARVQSFIHQLGYAARIHVPGTSYDLMVPPICIDAGLGQQGRHSILITPELGSNFRPAVITTDLPMQPDKPIDFGVEEFCKTCKVCAEQCPSGSISSKDEKVEVRGYKRWTLNAASCNNMWNSTLGSMGCRLCIASCPYTRKANWLHKTALKVTMNDPTGMTDEVLTYLQKKFYEGPDPQDYYIPSLGGKNATYRKPPWWLVAEDFIDLEGEE